jgi:hypothetical protein
MSAELKGPQALPAKKPFGRPFVKGQSGCPGGKRKEVARAEKAIAKLLPKAMIRLAALLDSEDVSLVIEGMKLVFKYTLTSADRKVDANLLTVTGPTLPPELAKAIANIAADRTEPPKPKEHDDA